jgi:hypothetical protein
MEMNINFNSSTHETLFFLIKNAQKGARRGRVRFAFTQAVGAGRRREKRAISPP